MNKWILSTKFAVAALVGLVAWPVSSYAYSLIAPQSVIVQLPASPTPPPVHYYQPIVTPSFYPIEATTIQGYTSTSQTTITNPGLQCAAGTTPVIMACTQGYPTRSCVLTCTSQPQLVPTPYPTPTPYPVYPVTYPTYPSPYSACVPNPFMWGTSCAQRQQQAQTFLYNISASLSQDFGPQSGQAPAQNFIQSNSEALSRNY